MPEVSPYLLQPCRTLEEACRTSWFLRGRRQPPCRGCSLGDMCRAMAGDAAEVPTFNETALEVPEYVVGRDNHGRTRPWAEIAAA